MTGFDFPKIEEKILHFWKDRKIFEKSLELRHNAKRFVFWEGPPTANGLPHVGLFLTRIYKDLFGRYKTMRGYLVMRKAGWDTHGLPVEIEVEKKLGFTNKKQIEEYGIAKFNRKAREDALKYSKIFEKMSNMMGFWLDLDHPYITYENNYIESVWNILQKIWNKGLLYKAHKVVPFCIRCGTPLSAHEVAQKYIKVIERSVYIKFKVIGQKDTSILAWTTTPWTLPGNVALAVGADIRYIYVKKDGKILILAKDLAEKVIGQPYTVEKEVSGSDLVGLSYEPLFDVPKLQSNKSYHVYAADFVSIGDGTGVVHIAPMYGEDDYNLGWQVGLPTVHTVDELGSFVAMVNNGLAGKSIIENGKKSKATEDFIVKILTDKNLLFKSEDYEHDYPFCWRCDTPLIYFAKTSWFIKTSAINKELLANNATVNWIPEHIKEGRFGEWLRAAKDWTLSRERYWGTPLPIWECEQPTRPTEGIRSDGCDHKTTIGSIKELEKLSFGSKNTYYVMRHGTTTRNESTERIINSRLEKDTYHLTDEGRAEVKQSLRLLQLDGIDAIYASPFLRSKETADIASRFLHQEFEVDERLVENGHNPADEGKPEPINAELDSEGMESRISIRKRLTGFMNDMESKHRNKKILIVTHGGPMWFLEAIAHGFTEEELKNSTVFTYFIPALAELKKLTWRKIPRNELGELDLHRPFIDSVIIKCVKCKSKMRKIPDLIDVWFDSGAMPYAQWHYPFENKSIFKQQFPADFIVEAIDQTRGWFWTLLAISTLLGHKAPYKNVMVLGHTLDEKGKKMSKSKGNSMLAIPAMETYGADTLRWYFFSSVSIGESKAVIPKEIESKLKGFFFTLQNCIRFYELYALGNQQPAKPSILDKWILSRLHRLFRDTSVRLDAYDVTTAARAIEYFITEDLSNWWVRRSRKRKEALPLLRLVLLDVARLLAPFTPFTAEDLWHRLQGKDESVHLADWPKVIKKCIDDKLEAEMDRVKKIIALGLAQRKEKQLKVRQPLTMVSLKLASTSLGKRDKFNRELENLIKDELNVKDVKYNTEQRESLMFDLALTPALIQEGYAREIMRQIQDMRKEAKYKLDEKIYAAWKSQHADITETISRHGKEIAESTLLAEFTHGHNKKEVFDVEKEFELAPQVKIWLGVRKGN